MANTILMMDDDIKRMSSHVDLLRAEGYTVIDEPNTAEMIRRFRENKERVALIVLDMMMPVGDYSSKETDGAKKTGRAVLRDIRSISKTVPVIILSVRGDNGTRSEADSLGISAYMVKPVLPSELIRVIRKTLSR